MEKNAKSNKLWIIFTVIGAVLCVAGVVMLVLPFVLPKEDLPEINFPAVPSVITEDEEYSDLTGLALRDGESRTAPAYCIQTPNGMDGARPQAGLDQAGVIFEAIAEAGITRFAAIYQNPTSAVIGPIRSLRLYYLQWDTPFDCTIVHAGGADDALAAVRAGGYKDLTEDYAYMYRSGSSSRRWNNLFTTSSLLAEMNDERGYGGSEIDGFTRMTPTEALRARVDGTATEKLDIVTAAAGDTSELEPEATEIGLKFGGMGNFNVAYFYDADSNTYERNYESGLAHEILECPEENLGEANPDTTCEGAMLTPTVVIAMRVSEKRAWDNYHEDITTVGSGEAYIFQNGMVMHGTWRKNSVGSQIRFYDDSDVEIALIPGQTIVEAIPQYGSVAYE